jgi:hypothetical protein
VNEDFVNSIDEFYQYAEKIAPGYGKDIVHHIATELPNDIKNINAYVHTSIRNAWRNKRSSFNKIYRPQQYQELPDVPEIEYNGTKYDAILLHRIFLELEIEGYSLEVSVFKDCYLGSSITAFAEKTDIDYRVIKKICNFTKNEIIKRYRELDND